MFIEIRRVKSRKKYYLVHSYRSGSRTSKIRVYLGMDLNKSELKNKEVLARERIKKMVEEIGNIGDPYKTVLSGAELESIKNLDSLRKIKLQHLSEEDWLKFTEAFTYDTNAIEGSTVEKREVEDILENNEWPDKSKWEISETFGVSEAVKYIRTTKIHISVRLIKDLHMVVFKNSKPFAGKFRKMGEEVAVIDAYGKVIHRGAPSTKVTSLLKELLKWYKNNKRKYPPLVLAAVVHNQFENIHPFRDGNGRVGRLLLINILLKHNLPPVNIELKNRVEYYASLQSYENDGNIRPTLDLILKEYKKLSNVLKR
jgi:Fic family protein